MQVKTELQNCTLEIKYIGTEEQIAFQQLLDRFNNLSVSFRDLGEAINKALTNAFEILGGSLE